MNRGKRLHSCVLRLFGWAAVLTVLCATLYAAVPGSIFGLLTSDSRVVAASVDYRWWCAAIPVAGMAAFVWDGVFIGLTRTRAMTLAVAVAVAAFFALYAALPRSMGNQALWFAFVTYLALAQPGADGTIPVAPARHETTGRLTEKRGEIKNFFAICCKCNLFKVTLQNIVQL
jgi:Na+-driven multidrug efflux pump